MYDIKYAIIIYLHNFELTKSRIAYNFYNTKFMAKSKKLLHEMEIRIFDYIVQYINLIINLIRIFL